MPDACASFTFHDFGFSETPLHWTAFQDYDAVAQLLLDKGADTSATTEHGDTPLHLATAYGPKRVVRRLLEHGADVSSKNNDGETPLHIISRGVNTMGQWWHETVAGLLLEHGSDASAKNNRGETPLFLAIETHEVVARLLIDKGADLSAKTNNGESVEDHADTLGEFKIAAMIKEEIRFKEADAERMSRCVAFSIGQQVRLGEGSWVWSLDPGVVQMVLEVGQ